MSADLLRRAARAMRGLATDSAVRAAESPWHTYGEAVEAANGATVAEAWTQWHAEHIASWHPAVALAVADWLDDEAADVEAGLEGDQPQDVNPYALAVARAYLGEVAS